MAKTNPLRYIYRGADQVGVFAYAVSQGDTDGLMSLCSENSPPAAGPYVCLVPVRDYWRMSKASSRKHQVWHYSEGIESQILEDVRSRRSALIFDLCNEGPPYDPEVFHEFLHWIEINQLPHGQVVWLCQNRSMESQCKAHVGTRASLIRFEHYDFFVKVIAFYFAPNSVRTFLPVDPEVLISRMFDPASKDRMLLCMNATPRLPRVLAVSALIHHGLIANSLVSFPGMDYVKGDDSPDGVRHYVDGKPVLAYLKPSVEAALQLRGLRVDKFSEEGNALYDKIDVKPYERTFFSLVTETDFSYGTVIRITEKSVKPFCLGHPSVTIGNPHSVRFMTELGFTDWDNVIDRTYDLEEDPVKRFGLVFDEVQSQVRDIQDDPASWLARVRDVGAANIRHAFSGAFLSRYRDIYDRPVVARLSRMVNARNSND